ncbi:hypothetical protein B0H10DRAFT_2221561 [Mycena sp. CBHHK59/15]|nr:hypothetical protein B0H10DRAFT_2221561 [Mycena sp. CBHHK59/15]
MRAPASSAWPPTSSARNRPPTTACSWTHPSSTLASAPLQHSAALVPQITSELLVLLARPPPTLISASACAHYLTLRMRSSWSSCCCTAGSLRSRTPFSGAVRDACDVDRGVCQLRCRLRERGEDAPRGWIQGERAGARGICETPRRLAASGRCCTAVFFGTRALWDMLRVGERNGGSVETEAVWRARWGTST